MSKFFTKGIDVSAHQGKIDWQRVQAAGIDFAMLRACYGWDNDEQIDREFSSNVAGCTAAGMPYGLYHYSYAHTPADAVLEARFFLRVLSSLQPAYPLAFDFEDPSQVGGTDAKGNYYKGLDVAAQMEIIDAFMATLEQAGCYAVLYSSASALTRLYRFAPTRMQRYDCWVAHVGASSPAFPGTYGMWQYSWKGKIDGIQAEVDLNYSYKDYPAIIKAAGLNGWGKPDTPTEPPKLPTDAERLQQMILDLQADNTALSGRLEACQSAITEIVRISCAVKG